MFPYDQSVTSAILESSLDAAFTIRQDGRIVDVNTAATRMFGWARNEFIERNIASIVAEPHRSAHDTYLHKFDPHKGISHILGNGQLLKAQRKDGSHFPVEVGISRFSIDGQDFFTGFVRDMTERQAHVDELQRLANHDDDTGLLNYRGLLAWSKQHRADDHPICVFIRLKGFSRAVAAQGRSLGKQILQTVADRLRQFTQAGSNERVVARVGESAFALFATGNAMALAQECRSSINAPIPHAGMVIEIAAQIGISEDSGSFEQRFRDAMLACEHIDHGCGGINRYSASLAERQQRELHIESRLRTAVDQGALRLVLQPKIELRNERVVGAEALVRWQDAELGFVSPAEFIPIAERTGRIRPITDWVLAQSLAAIGPHADRDLSVAVNFSSLDFQQPDLTRRVEQALEAAGVAPGQLIIELTESSVADEPAATAARMHELKALGIAISLDDFGTGYSSLSYLRQFPIDTLKIDASFVRHTPDDADANAIAGAICALSGALGLSTVAGGIETRAQADFLNTLNVDQGQGYLFAKPLSIAGFASFVGAHP